MASLLTKFRLKWKEPFPNKLYAARVSYWRFCGLVYYRRIFRKFGAKTVLFRPLLLLNTDCIEIGDGVQIRDGARLEAIRDSFGRTPLLSVGDGCLIEQGIHIACHSRVIIGRNVTIAARCAILDTTHPYQAIGSAHIGSELLNDDSFVEIGDGAFLGYGAVVLPNVRIGEKAVIGANAVVTRDVPPYSVVAGVPAKLIKQYSESQRAWVAASVGVLGGEA